MGTVIFEMPNSPEEFGVSLAPAQLRSLDFTALDFPTLNRAGVEYIRSYYPNDFNDFFASNGVIMMLELVAYIGGVISERSDILVDESFLSTSQTKQAVIQHLNLINQRYLRATPAIVDVEISLPNAVPSEVRIPSATRFTLGGPDGRQVNYEIYRSPGDWTSFIVIPPNKRGIIAYGIEGQTATPIIVVSPGGPDQYVDIELSNVLEEPIIVQITSGQTVRTWRQIEMIETAEANDEVYEVKYLGDRTRIVFGNNQAGKSPLAGQTISVQYRVGGGVRGRIASNTINETRPISPQPPASASVEVLFRNPSPSSGGTDEETLDQAKRRAPKQYATHGNAVSGEDYGLLASEFKHQFYGAVSKAIGVIRTGVDQDLTSVVTAVRAAPTVEDGVKIIQNNFINRNIVEVYALAEGPDGPVKPSSGLKQGLISYLEEINVLTDEVRVYDGAVKPIDVDATIVMSRNADPGTVKVAVQNAIDDFFNIDNWDMGTALYVSKLYQIIQDIPGVTYVDIFKPVDDVLPTESLASDSDQGIGFNGVITKGQITLRYYFEQGNFKVTAH